MSDSRSPRYYLVFDVESVGLHGDAFAVGYVVVDAVDGAVVERGLAWCDATSVRQGSPVDRDWIANHVPAMPPENRVTDERALRAWFWAIWDRWAAEGAWMAADCPWPVEARFLHACIGDNPSGRMWAGPYPLIDVASVRLARGLNPLGTEERYPDELPMHNPLADACQSARLLMETSNA